MEFSRNSSYRTETKSFCEVCGDKARGCNFDAITCASCKEFFRRNAFKQKILKCYFQDNCTIDVISRRFCGSCRLRKCFSIGMKREYIMSEEQRHARKVKITGKKHTKNPRNLDNNMNSLMTNSVDDLTEEPMYETPVPIVHSSPCSPSTAIDSPDLPVGSIVNSNLFGFKPRPLDESHSRSIFEKLPDVRRAERREDYREFIGSLSSDVDMISKLLNKVKIIRESSYYPTKYALLCRQSEQMKELSMDDKHRLKHLVSGIQLMQAETIHALPCSGRFVDILKTTEIITFMLIKMCKKLTAFQELSQADQIALVKGACMETLLLRSIMTINLEKECWEGMDLERNCKFSLKMEVLKEVNPRIYEAHLRYARSFQPEWRFDDNVMSLLIAITIFCPDRHNLTAVDNIRRENQTYIDLLRKHLETIYDPSMVEITFMKLMGQLELTKTISESHVKSYFDVSTSKIEESGISRLLLEIFDLNARNTEKDN